MALNYGQITAITEKYFIPKLQDGVYKSAAFIARLSRPEKLLKIDGGTKIIAPIINSKPGSNRYFDDLDVLDSTRTDNITAAEFEWKQIYEPIRVSRKELLMNNGDAAKLNLVKSKVQIAEKSMRDNLSIGIFSDGTAATGALTTKQITGLRAILSESSTYGGIAVADFADWKAVVEDNGAVSRALTLPLLQKAFGLATEENDKPTVSLAKQAIYDQLWSLYQPHQRLMSEDMAKLGFKNVLEFNGIPVVVDSHMKDGSIFLINEDYVQLAVHSQENMRKETLEKLETSNSMLMRIFWMGNLICSNRRFQAELADLEYSA